MITRSREFGEGTGGGSVVLTRDQKTSKEAIGATLAAVAAAGLGQGDARRKRKRCGRGRRDDKERA
eukprot:1978972-Prymnesium_polylepis.1